MTLTFYWLPHAKTNVVRLAVGAGVTSDRLTTLLIVLSSMVWRVATATAVLVVVTMSGVSRAIVGFLFSLALPRQGRVSRLYVAELASSIVSELFW